MPDVEIAQRLSTGIAGLNEVLYGGLLPRRSYLVRGGAGTGKTTLGIHFLAAGVANGERVLYITLGESEAGIRQDAKGFGFDLTGLPVLDLSPTPEFFTKVKTYDIFTPADVEREPTTQKIIEQVERLKPQRVFVDAITQFRHLASDSQQFHKQTLAFLNYLTENQATVLFTSESSRVMPDDDLQFHSDGIITLGVTEHGRTLKVGKFRGSGYQEGRHALRITDRGLTVYPRLLPEAFRQPFVPEVIPSGIAALDEVLHGGVERGTTTLITGPSGVGKTTLALHFVHEAAKRGEHSVVYVLEEPLSILTSRSEALHIPISSMIENGTLSLFQVEPHRYMPEEFVGIVRQAVEQRQARLVMIDSIAAYRKFLRGDDLMTDLHTLCQYLQNMGVKILLTNEIEQIAGEFQATEFGVSYLAGNIIYLRYLERRTKKRTLEIGRCVGVLKKRLTDFEKTVRELEITNEGMKVAEPIFGLQGVLSAMPLVDECLV